jgi:hypothetical protein
VLADGPTNFQIGLAANVAPITKIGRPQLHVFKAISASFLLSRRNQIEGQSHEHVRVISQADVYEDWSFLRDPSLRVDPYDRLKFIPLNDSKTNYLTFGLESWTEFQYLSNNNWGSGLQNPGVVLERLMPDIPRKRAERRPYPRLGCVQGRWVWRLRLQPGRDEEAQPQNGQTAQPSRLPSKLSPKVSVTAMLAHSNCRK